MVDTNQHILDVFSKNPYAEYTTTELVKILYPEEYKRLRDALLDNTTDKESVKIAKRRKGQLHRRILYHLGRLVEEGELTVNSVKGKGEKSYVLVEKNVPLTTEHISKQPLLALEEYEEKNMMYGYDTRSWNTRVNALLLTIGEEDSTKTILETLQTAYEYTNDVIGINGIEEIVRKEDLGRLSTFIREIDMQTRDNGRRISISLPLHKKNKSIEDFCELIARHEAPHINIVFHTTNKELLFNKQQFERIVVAFSTVMKKIHVCNKDVCRMPVIIGKAGVYSTDTITQSERLVCVTQNSVAIDIKTYLEEGHTPNELREFIIKIAKTIMESNKIQRRKKIFEKTVFSESNSIIRIWNYDWKEEQNKHFIALLKSCVEELKAFCCVEETIFRSCGIPMHLRIEMGSALPKFKEGMSKRTYKTPTIQGIHTIEGKEFLENLEKREEISATFSHNDRIRFFRTQPFNKEDITKEIKYILDNYLLGLVTYDFSPRKEFITLDQFMS